MTTIDIWVIACATLLGPILAVQAQKWIERGTERTRGRRHIFSVLMATRATRLSSDHVNALNRIELEFSGRGSKAKAVRDAWRLYADKLNVSIEPNNDAAVAAWASEREMLFLELMFAMSGAVGYDFDRVQIRRGVYYPVDHSDSEIRQRRILIGLENVLAGKQAIPIEPVVSDDLVTLQTQLYERMSSAYSDGALSVRTADDKKT